MELFAPPDFDYQTLRDQLTAAAADGVYLGTSSWKYPGWLGTVYQEQNYLGRGGKVSEALLDRTCLREYAMLFPTVCVDAAYYRFPIREELLGMAAQVPASFRFSLKVTDEITIKHFPQLPKFGSRGGTANPHFLDAELFKKAFLAPCESIAEKLGLIIFEFSPLDAATAAHPEAMIAQFDRFFAALPAGWNYGVEIRNREFLVPAYLAMLAAHRISHIYNSWTEMPALADQLACPNTLTNPLCTGARLLLKPGRKYQAAVDAFSPYTQIHEALPALRAATASFIRERRSGEIDML